MTSPRHGQGLMSSLNASLVPGASGAQQLERVMVRSISCSEIVESWRHPVVSPAMAILMSTFSLIFQIGFHIRWTSIWSQRIVQLRWVLYILYGFMLIVIKVLGLQAFGRYPPDVDIVCRFNVKRQNGSQAKVHESGRGGA